MASTRGRGFASMNAEKQREIASKGGKAAHAKGTAHQFTPDEARDAGRKGGLVVSQDRQHMSAIGREGGQSRGRKHSDSRQDTESNFVTTQREPESSDLRSMESDSGARRRDAQTDQRNDRNTSSMRQQREE